MQPKTIEEVFLRIIFLLATCALALLLHGTANAASLVQHLPADGQKIIAKQLGDYTYVGTFWVTVPAGKFGAILLRSKVEGKIGPAHTHATSYSFFAPGAGPIAMILQQKVTAFCIYNVDGAGGKVLVSR